ncbi:hypothetical protein CLHUN_21050 [Ruminiclostridium hungatei]|uniref:Uncharacterized protein n=1 Tax=Ruminiclostridium hungatei TaxID=48256 RepID=A0A1V4SJP1_RUMHU|nr:hypothetical protein [Ruminiclostridium hungatei]OPX44080.1 hypothetical protein CLHUN_21050 [Ruminiclostridium hungatei]
MLQQKKYIFIVISIIVLLCVVLVIYFTLQSRPRNVIEDKLKIRLPSTSSTVNYHYNNDGGYFKAKILIEEKTLIDLKSQLDVRFFGQTMSKSDIAQIPNFKGTCQWWDLNIEDIDVGYMNFIDEKKLFGGIYPHQVWAFITKEKDGRYYLYISY